MNEIRVERKALLAYLIISAVVRSVASTGAVDVAIQTAHAASK